MDQKSSLKSSSLCEILITKTVEWREDYDLWKMMNNEG